MLQLFEVQHPTGLNSGTFWAFGTNLGGLNSENRGGLNSETF